MRPFSRAATILLILLAPVLILSGTAGAKESSAPAQAVDGTTSTRIREAWSEIHDLQREGETAEAERKLREYASEFFEIHVAHPGTTEGRQALATAFRMWGRAGDCAAIEAAMGRIDRGSRHWAQLIELARPAFVDADRLGEFRGIVAGLAGKLTDPVVASEVWINLGRDYRSSADLERAADCFHQAENLDADPRLVDAARTALRQLDRLAVGRTAPGFTATDLEGGRIRLSDHQGRHVLLLFWSSDCESCLPEIDRIRWIRAAHAPETLAVIGVTLDSRAEDVQRVVRERRIEWPQIFDEQGADGPVARLYEVRETPRSFLIDPEGIIVGRDRLGEELETFLEELLPPAKEAEAASASQPSSSSSAQEAAPPAPRD